MSETHRAGGRPAETEGDPSMSTFLFTYRVPKDYIPGSPEVVPAWRAYFDGLSANLLDVGNPVFERTTLGRCAADTVLGGYSLVSADDLDAAVALAAGCPVLTIGGGVEVGELTLLNPDKRDHHDRGSRARHEPRRPDRGRLKRYGLTPVGPRPSCRLSSVASSRAHS
jgi:hypothetical protein